MPVPSCSSMREGKKTKSIECQAIRRGKAGEAQYRDFFSHEEVKKTIIPQRTPAPRAKRSKARTPGKGRRRSFTPPRDKCKRTRIYGCSSFPLGRKKNQGWTISYRIGTQEFTEASCIRFPRVPVHEKKERCHKARSILIRHNKEK